MDFNILESKDGVALSVPISEIATICEESENRARRKRVESIIRADTGRNILAIKIEYYLFIQEVLYLYMLTNGLLKIVSNIFNFLFWG